MLKKSMMLPVLAVIVGAAASAFTVSGNTTAKNDQTMFWYTYNPSTNQIVSEIGQGEINEQEAEEITGCTDQVSPVCAKGYTTQQTGLPKTAPAGAKDLLRAEE